METTETTAGPGALSRMAGVFTSPAKTFEDIGRRPGGWWVPALLLIALTVVGALLVAPRLDVDPAVERTLERIESRNTAMDDAQKEKMETAIRGQYEFMTSGPGRFIGPVFVLIPLFLVPLFWHGIAAAWGKAGTYKATLTAYAYVQLVQAVKGVLVILVAVSKDSIDVERVNTLLKSSLGAFLDPETTSRPLMALATNIDIFEIWALVLGCLALPRVTRLSPRGGAAVVIGLWLLWVCLQTGLAALGAAFGG